MTDNAIVVGHLGQPTHTSTFFNARFGTVEFRMVRSEGTVKAHYRNHMGDNRHNTTALSANNQIDFDQLRVLIDKACGEVTEIDLKTASFAVMALTTMMMLENEPPSVTDA